MKVVQHQLDNTRYFCLMNPTCLAFWDNPCMGNMYRDMCAHWQFQTFPGEQHACITNLPVELMKPVYGARDAA